MSNTNNLIEIANEMRQLMLTRASTHTDFHLSSGLGIVELSIALDEIFDADKNKILFDVGHQRYPFLMLQEKRKGGQLQFPETNDYDMFCYPGFAGLAAASALGYAIAYPKNKVIAVIGDGALSCGETYEALNCIGELQANILIILNQNGMSITKNVGALSDGKTVELFAKSLRLDYKGICDGHDIDGLIKVLKHQKGPLVLHVQTVKGRGYCWAEKNPTKFHMSFYPFDPETGLYEPNQDAVKRLFIEAMNKLETKGISYIEEYHDVYFTFPAMPTINRIQEAYPKNVLDTGISEQCCMTLSTTLAGLNKRVIMLIGAVFLTRCYSQLYDLCHQKSPLTVILNLTGVTHYGSTHQAVYTVGLLRPIPHATILYPVNLIEFEQMLDFAFRFNQPVFLQIPKENISMKNTVLSYGKGVLLKKGDRITILVIGGMFHIAFYLAGRYDEVEIVNPRFLKPFDYELLKKSIKKTGRLLIIEEGFRKGGLGEEILSFLKETSITCKTKLIAAADIFVSCHHYNEVCDEYGLTVSACEKAIQTLLRKTVQLSGLIEEKKEKRA